MPRWSNTIPDEPNANALPLLRCPPHGTLVATITSPEMIGTYTHYWHGRTIPCDAPHCDACQSGMPYRWHAYLGAWLQSKALHFLFECTAAAADPFALYFKAHGTLRGCMFEAQRWRATPNSRVLIRTKTADLTQIVLPHAPDVIAALSIIWNLPLNRAAETRRNPERSARQLWPNQAAAMAAGLIAPPAATPDKTPGKNGDR